MLLTLTDVPRWTRLSPLTEGDQAALTVLTERLRAGDAPVVERVLLELVPSVEGWVRRLLGPHTDLEDVQQEALTEIARALHRFEGRSSIHTLAHRITTRTAARFYGRRPPGEALDVEHLPTPDEGPERTTDTRQQAELLYRHLEAMSEVRRTAFVLCCLEELSPTEAAAVVGCSAVTMRSRLFEARAELVERMSRDEQRGARRR